MNKMLYAVCSLALAALMVFRTSKEEVHSFVQQRDGQFLIGRQPYKFVGTNFWYGAILGSEGATASVCAASSTTFMHWGSTTCGF